MSCKPHETSPLKLHQASSEVRVLGRSYKLRRVDIRPLAHWSYLKD